MSQTLGVRPVPPASSWWTEGGFYARAKVEAPRMRIVPNRLVREQISFWKVGNDR